MTVAVEIKGLKEAEKFLKMFPEEARRVHTLALNRAAANAKTAAVQGITETYTINPAAVLKDLSLHRATEGNPVALFRSSGRPRSLGHFNTTPGFVRTSPKSGFFTQVVRGQGGALSGDYFWLRFKSGFTSLFRRTGKGKSALDPAASVSTPQMVGHPAVQKRVEHAAVETLEKVFTLGMQKAILRRAQ